MRASGLTAIVAAGLAVMALLNYLHQIAADTSSGDGNLGQGVISRPMSVSPGAVTPLCLEGVWRDEGPGSPKARSQRSRES